MCDFHGNAYGVRTFKQENPDKKSEPKLLTTA
jgi:hypothetical protein